MSTNSSFIIAADRDRPINVGDGPSSIAVPQTRSVLIEQFAFAGKSS